MLVRRIALIKTVVVPSDLVSTLRLMATEYGFKEVRHATESKL